MSRKIIYKCDRCETEWEEAIVNGYGNCPKHVEYDAYSKLDLCETCWLEFYEATRKWKNESKEEIEQRRSTPEVNLTTLIFDKEVQ